MADTGQSSAGPPPQELDNSVICSTPNCLETIQNVNENGNNNIFNNSLDQSVIESDILDQPPNVNKQSAQPTSHDMSDPRILNDTRSFMNNPFTPTKQTEEFTRFDHELKHLTKNEYIEKLIKVSNNSEEAIIRYRSGLLCIAKQNTECPKGKLISRKSTTKSTAQLKTAKDCYILKSYVNGDDTQICDIFTNVKPNIKQMSLTDDPNDSSICENRTKTTESNIDLQVTVRAKHARPVPLRYWKNI